MALIVGIKFRNTNKTYYFDPKDISFEDGEGVIVETAKGVEYGKVVIANKQVDDSEIVSPLKPVIRKATLHDEKQIERNEQDKAKAIQIVGDKVQKLNLAMKIVDAEYTFDRHKLIFYFTADGRIDFRELVRELASIFKVRIELRQIYERDDTKMRGALAICGRPCCCTSHLPDFEKVSIKMAKVQGLSLNPQKISGVCGRLMCCLKYENDHYNETYKQMPKIGSKVKTPKGDAVVEANDLLRKIVTVKIFTNDGAFERHAFPVDEIHFRERQSTKDINDETPDDLKNL